MGKKAHDDSCARCIISLSPSLRLVPSSCFLSSAPPLLSGVGSTRALVLNDLSGTAQSDKSAEHHELHVESERRIAARPLPLPRSRSRPRRPGAPPPPARLFPSACPQQLPPIAAATDSLNRRASSRGDPMTFRGARSNPRGWRTIRSHMPKTRAALARAA